MPLTPTGRRWSDPTGALVEYTDGQRLLMAVELDEDHRDHVEVTSAPLEDFHKALGHHRNVPDLVEIDREAGRYVYATGPAWPLAEALARAAAAGEVLGIKAAVELLDEASASLEAASNRGAGTLETHLGLTPWRVLLAPGGRVLIIGWGLAQVDVLPDSEAARVEPSALQSCPPERIEGREEGPSADRFALCMMAAHMVLGEPLYRGDLDDVLDQARRGMAQEALHRDRHRFDPLLLSLLDRATDRYPDSRHRDGRRFRRAVHEVMGSSRVSGPSLTEWTDWLAEAAPLPMPEPTEPSAAPAARQQRSSSPRWEAPEPREEPARRVSASTRERRQGIQRRRTRRLREPRDRNALYPNWRLPEDAVRYRIVLEDGDKRWVALDPDESLACSAARVADAVLPSPVDCSGRLRGWYRLWQGEQSWYGDERTAVLDPDLPVDVEHVANTDLEVIVVVGEDEHPLTVGTGVHAQFLVAAIVRDLELGGHGWRLQVDGTPVDPWQLLDDWELAPGARIELTKRRR